MVPLSIGIGEGLPVLDPHKVALEVEEVNLRAVCMRRDVKGHELPAERLCIHGRLVTEGIDEERIRRVELFDSLEGARGKFDSDSDRSPLSGGSAQANSSAAQQGGSRRLRPKPLPLTNISSRIVSTEPGRCLCSPPKN